MQYHVMFENAKWQIPACTTRVQHFVTGHYGRHKEMISIHNLNSQHVHIGGDNSPTPVEKKSATVH